MRSLAATLRRGAELAAAAMFAVMFGAFLLQIFMRYVVNQPLDWSLEVSLIAYLWIVFWCAAFLVRDRDHVAFTMIYVAAPPAWKRGLAIVSLLAAGGLFALALPATFDFVSFMAIDVTWALELRFDLVFSVYLMFVVAVILRSCGRLYGLLGSGWRDHL